MRSDLLRYASKKIFSLCIMVVGHTHGLGGSKGCSRLGRRSGDLMPSLIYVGKTPGELCLGNSSLVSAAVRDAAATVTARAT